MAGKDRAAAHDLEYELSQNPYRFDFFQAARRFECARKDLPRIGQSLRPSDDAVRFCQSPTLAFAPSTLVGLERGRGQAPRFEVAFFGLFGPNGPLPLHLTDYARDRLRNHKDPALVRFLDIFHHRMLSLFYRAWACNQQSISFDRPDEDRFAVYIGSLFGIGMESFRKRDASPDLAKLHYSGRLACQTCHGEGLEAILADYFKVPIEIEQFVGRWIDLPKDCRCLLGDSPETCSLGTTAIVGSHIWDCQGNFRIKLGPVNFKDYERLLPGGDSFERLVAWVRNYIGDELAWDVQMILEADEVPSLCLGRVGKLGWSTWLISQPVEKNKDDLVLRPMTS